MGFILYCPIAPVTLNYFLYKTVLKEITTKFFKICSV